MISLPAAEKPFKNGELVFAYTAESPTRLSGRNMQSMYVQDSRYFRRRYEYGIREAQEALQAKAEAYDERIRSYPHFTADRRAGFGPALEHPPQSTQSRKHVEPGPLKELAEKHPHSRRAATRSDSRERCRL